MIYVTRHGQTDWNTLRKVMGHCDIPLNEQGISQANTMKETLKNVNIDLIICSPLIRTKQTALILNEVLNIEIVYDDRIIERDFGEFEGLETKDFDFWGYWDYYKNSKYVTAENIQDFFNRIYAFLEDMEKNYHDKNILLVTHGGVSIPIACYFNKNIPEGPLVEKGLVLGNCEIKSF